MFAFTTVYIGLVQLMLTIPDQFTLPNQAAACIGMVTEYIDGESWSTALYREIKADMQGGFRFAEAQVC